jgi:hypothetical protein
MSDAADADGKAPFQIRAFPVVTRKLALACANKSGLTIPEWMDRAVHSQARLDQGENIFPPSRPGSPAPPPTPLASDADLIGLLHAAAALAATDPERKVAAIPGLKTLLAERVRSARGLPPVKLRQTYLTIGKTMDAT